MTELLQKRANERKIYEEIVDIIVDYVNKEYGTDSSARLRIYALIADNFKGMVNAFSLSPTNSPLTNIQKDSEDG